MHPRIQATVKLLQSVDIDKNLRVIDLGVGGGQYWPKSGLKDAEITSSSSSNFVNAEKALKGVDRRFGDEKILSS